MVGVYSRNTLAKFVKSYPVSLPRYLDKILFFIRILSTVSASGRKSTQGVQILWAALHWKKRCMKAKQIWILSVILFWFVAAVGAFADLEVYLRFNSTGA